MKNKILTFILTLCLILPCMLLFTACDNTDKWDGKVADVPMAINNVIKISTAEEFAGFAKSVNEGNTYEGYVIRLTNDLDLQNKEFEPIGYGYTLGDYPKVYGKSFNGIFDGQNHTIYNLNVVGKHGGIDEGSAGVGLFGLLLGTIKNLTVDTATITGNHYVGVIAGYATNKGFDCNGKIVNCHVKNATVNCNYLNDDESGDKAGAIVGMLINFDLTNCSATDCNVKADRDAGWLIGTIVFWQENDFTSDNNAVNVTVECNNTSNSAKSGTNINEDIVGRVA